MSARSELVLSLPPVLQSGWEESSASLPAEDTPKFLKMDEIDECGRWCSLPADAIEACCALACRLVSTEERHHLELAWHLWRLLFEYPPLATHHGDPLVEALPGSIGDLGSATGTLYLLLLLGGVPMLLDLHKRRGIPEDVTRDSLSDIHVWARAHFTGGLSPLAARGTDPVGNASAGIWGLSVVDWPLRTLRGELLRMGRLQFREGPFEGPFMAFRQRQGSRRLQLVCAEAGLEFDAAGLRAAPDSEPAFRSVYEREQATVLIATPVLANGIAGHTPVRMVLEEWEQILAPGSPVLEIHVPEDGPMPLAACGASMRTAAAKWHGWRLERAEPSVRFACYSWLLDPEWQRRLPPSSNVVRLQQAGSALFPVATITAAGINGTEGYKRIFTEDLSLAERVAAGPSPSHTSMQKAFLEHSANGGRWVGGGMILLPEALSQPPWMDEGQ